MKVNEREIIDNYVEKNRYQESLKSLEKNKRFKDAIKSTEIDKDISKLMELKNIFRETKKTNKEFNTILKKDEEIENQRKMKLSELNENVNLALNKQLKEKNVSIKIEIQKKNLLDNEILRDLDNRNTKENEKRINKKIYLSKFKEDWNDQTLNKTIFIEMDPIEKQINKDLFDEMLNYNSPTRGKFILD